MHFYPSRKHNFFLLFIISFLLCLLVLLIFGVSHFSSTETERYHTELLEEMEHANSFQELTDALFRYEVTSDSITTAYTLKHPDQYNIPTLSPKLTSFSFEEYIRNSKKKNGTDTSRFLADCLAKFSSDQLTEEEQLTCSLLQNSIATNYALSKYPFYEDLLGSNTGIQTNLPVTLGEYPLHDKKEIKIYLQLIKQIPDYFDDVISYQKHRTKLGIRTPSFQTSAALDSIQTMLEGFQNGDNSFIDTFDERIAQIDNLSDTQRKKYKKQNLSYVKKYVIPAYENLLAYFQDELKQISDIQEENHTTDTSSLTNIDRIACASPPYFINQHNHLCNTNLTTASPTTSDSTNTEPKTSSLVAPDTPYGLSTLPQGTDYYSLLAKDVTGSSKSVPELITMTEQALENALGDVLNTALTDQKAYLHYCEHPLETYYQSPEAILEALSLMMRENYPLLSEAPAYDIKMVPDSLAASLSPAFYMIPAIDDYQNNTIYINQLYTNAENGNLFTTLAHEGFPGHLYQTVYFNESNPTPIRQILNYLGYVEGWATYVEMDSFTFVEYPMEGNSLCKLYQAETIINLALCSRIDMGVNYENWTLNDTKAFFEENGFNSYYAEDVYTYVVEAPANYLSYFIGYLEIMELKDAYQRQEMENYSEKEFHKKLLDIGPADFETIRRCLLK